jgi:hypothetical protein
MAVPEKKLDHVAKNNFPHSSLIILHSNVLKKEFLEVYNSELKSSKYLKFDYVIGLKNKKYNKKITHFKKR